MIDPVSPTTLAAIAILLAAAALIIIVLSTRSLRIAADRRAAEQAEALRWVSEQMTDTVDRFHARLAEFGGSLDGRLDSSQRALGAGLAEATQVYGELQDRIGRVTEIATRMDKLAAGVEDLGRILTVPKLRGLMGEQTLEAMLRQVLPPHLWSLQHRFTDGRTVDAVVRLGEALLPVDAKFPLESYRRLAEAGETLERAAAGRDFDRAVKAQVDEIASRYIRPDEGTVDFALMFIPAEGVYAEMLSGTAGTGQLLDMALSKRVLPVSPATIFAFLSVVASGLRGLDIQENTRELLRELSGAEQELHRAREDAAVLGRHLTNAAQKNGDLQRRLDSLGARLERAVDHPDHDPT
jgi:DNA recombination protein RmuC